MVKYQLARGDICEWRPFRQSHQISHGARLGSTSRDNLFTEQLVLQCKWLVNKVSTGWTVT